MDVTKESGQKEEYQRNKLCDSLERAGAAPHIVERVCAKIDRDIKDGITTDELFKRAFKYLGEEDLRTAARYSIKRGIAALGPAGFVFEQYIERVLNAYGYATKRNVILKGVCVSHEIDLMANKDKEHFLVEIKYHNKGGIKTDITVAMYADARLADIAPVQEKEERGWHTAHGMWLITNTKFTTTAIQYGLCKNIKMTGWSYPKKESLEHLVIQKSLYPVTSLPSVSRRMLPAFAQAGIMLASDVAQFTPESLAAKLGLKKRHMSQILAEALVCLVGQNKK